MTMITPIISSGQREALTVPSKSQPTLEQLNAALRAVYDLWEYWPYMLFGDTANGVKEGKLYGDKIELGIQSKYLTKDVLSAIKTHLQYEIDRGRCEYSEVSDKWIKYTWKLNKSDLVSVPIECKVIHRNYQFFKNPDHVVYNYDEFRVPNPFEKYYKARFIVR